MATFLMVLILFGAILELLSLMDGINDIHYRCTPSKLGCEPEEIFTLQTVLSNYSRRTISFLRMEELYPKQIKLLGIEELPAEDHHCRLHVSMLYIRKRQRLTRTVQVSMPSRGVYRFEGCRLFLGDFLGLKEKSREITQNEKVVIFPALLKEEGIQQLLSGYYGDFSSKRYYIEDPILVSSFLDYSGREPMRSISWTQSARRNQLMVKEFDHTMDMSVTIVLDVYLHWSEGANREELEYCFSLVRTIAEYMERRKVSYRLITNAYIRSENTSYEGLERAGQGAHHYTNLLYTLGQAEADSFHDAIDLYQRMTTLYTGENAIFYVAPFRTEKRQQLVTSLQQRFGIPTYPMYASDLMEVKKDAI
jgi:hypothetical protein